MLISEENRKNFSAYIIGVLVVTVLLILNSVTDNKLTFDLTPIDDVCDGYTLYSPRLSLPKGEYEFEIAGDGNYIVTNTDGTKLGSGNGVIDVVLGKDESEIIIKSEVNSDLRVVVKKEGPIFNDIFLRSLLIMAFLLYLGYIRFITGVNISKHTVYIILIITAVVSSYPLFTDYVSYGQDIDFHLFRIEGLKDGLLSGQFPVRIDPTHNNGYGYITASIYPGLFLYLPAFLRLFGISLVMAYKLFLFTVNLATAFIMYKCTKNMVKSEFAGLFSAVVYTLSTWRLENMFFRAALGETLAMTFFPIVILGFYYVFKDDKSKWWVLTLGCSAVFQSHIISCIIVFMFGIVTLITFRKNLVEEKRSIALVKSAGLTVLLNLWYLVPFLTYYFSVDLVIRHTPENTEYFSNAIFPAEMFNIFNDKFGFSQLIPAGIPGNMSLSLGLGVTCCLIVVIWYFVFKYKRKREDGDFYILIFVFSLFALFMASTLFPSELFQRARIFNVLAGIIRLPWRFLSIASSMICIVAAMAVASCMDSRCHKGTVMAVTGFLCVLSVIHFGTAYTTTYNAVLKKGQAAPNAYSAGWDDEYFIYGTNKELLEPEKYVASGSQIEIISYEKHGTNIDVKLEGASDGDYIEVPLLYYPGYSAVDGEGEKLAIHSGENNVLRVSLTSKTDSIKIRYEENIGFRIADIVSLLTLICSGIFSFWKEGLNAGRMGHRRK